MQYIVYAPSRRRERTYPESVRTGDNVVTRDGITPTPGWVTAGKMHASLADASDRRTAAREDRLERRRSMRRR
jgi:hypothetical protein